MLFFVCLYVCLGFIVPHEDFSVIWRRHHYRWRAANFDLCLELMAIEQWGFFSVPHLLWHGAFVYNGHLRGPVTHTFCRVFGSGAVTTSFYDLGLSRLGFEHPTFHLQGQRTHPLRQRHGQVLVDKKLNNLFLDWAIIGRFKKNPEKQKKGRSVWISKNIFLFKFNVNHILT